MRIFFGELILSVGYTELSIAKDEQSKKGYSEEISIRWRECWNCMLILFLEKVVSKVDVFKRYKSFSIPPWTL